MSSTRGLLTDSSLNREASRASDVLLISTGDWDNPYWTNKQHMAMQLAHLGHRVFYIESQGLRAPTATAKDFKRIWARLKAGLRSPRHVNENIWVWSPIVIPLQRISFIRKINKALLQAGISFWCWWLRLSPRLCWTYSPLTTELYDITRYSLVVYHAVDDIKAQPGMPTSAIERAERNLSQCADIIFTTAHALQRTHQQLNANTHYFSNVADYTHFNKATSLDTVIPADIEAIPHPRIGFIGAISSYKLDFELIAEIARARPGWSFVFVGEVGEGDPSTNTSALPALSNVHFLGGRGYGTLPGYLRGMDVVMQPNRINDYTRSMFPMKFFEYLAGGKRIVSTKLPALIDYAHVASFCNNIKEFEDAIERALRGEGPTLEERLAVAREKTYEVRTGHMMRLVTEALTAKDSVRRC